MEKTYELRPNTNNLLETFKSDSIGRNKNIISFINLLNSITDNCSIAVNGDWGSGKTFFVKQVEHIINSINGTFNTNEDVEFKKEYEKYNQFPLNKQRVIYYDAWQHDDEIDPIYSLVFSIVNETNAEYETKNNDKLKCFLIKTFEIMTNSNILSSLDEIKESEEYIKTKDRIQLKEEFTNMLHDTIAEEYGRLIIIVDELDRCCPSFAIKVLERLKHYFDDELITFIFSTNLKELNCTIRKYYGDDFDATGYLNRFFDFVIDIPIVDIDKYCSLIGTNRNSRYVINYYKTKLIKQYKLSMREIAKYMRMTNIISGKKLLEKIDSFSINRSDEFLLYFEIFIVPVIVILRIKDFNKYTEFINGKNGLPFVEAMFDYDYEWAEKLLLSVNETFKLENINSRLVKIDKKQRLMEAYNTIFSDFKDDEYQRIVGSMIINKNTKDYLFDVVNMLSNMTNI